MTKILKIFSAAILSCVLLWSAEALAQGLPRAPKDILDMNVSITCKDGDATFTITNKGEAWPGVGNLSVYTTGAAKLIHNRRMRLGQGQRVTFRVPGAAGDNPEFGLWVDASWFKRDFSYDAKIMCS